MTEPSVSFTDVQRVLGLFADGMAGAAIPIEVADDERSVWPWTSSVLDEPVVRMPAVAEDFASGVENRGALRATVLHQTGLAEFGAFDEGRDGREQAFDAASRPALVRRVFGVLEDRRVDAATRAHYPGACGDLDRLLALARGAAPPEAPVEWRAAVVESLQLHSLGAGRDELLARVLPGLRPVLETILDLAGSPTTADESARAALAIGDVLEEDLDIEGDPTFAVTAPVEIDQPGTVDPPDDRPRPDAEVPRPPSVDMHQDETDRTQLGRLADIDALDPDVPVEEDEPAPPGRKPTDLIYPPAAEDRDARIFFYDEWDHLAQRTLPAWCRVVERRLVGEDRTFIGDVRRRYGVLIGRLRRQLAFMRPEGWLRVHHADQGDELDLDAVIEAVVDRRTGHSVDDRLHIRRDRAVRDVATAFLVDLSASTSSPIPDEEAMAAAAAAMAAAEEQLIDYRGGWIDPYEQLPPPEIGRRILDVAKESVAVMCDALELLGDRHAVYGFSGEGRHRVDVHVAKEFDDRTSPATWGALSAMRSLKYTRMGPAVRHATAKLAAQPTRTKLLMVISDGYPQDVDYGPIRGDREYGLQDTARALRDAVAAGITPYLVTIDPAGHEYLRRMLPDRSYVVIEDVHSLPRELATLYGSVASNSSRGW
jgi:nitric oxide reductase NorD protein